MRRVWVVCLGNICRSPMAEAVLRAKLAAAGLADVEVRSAGTGAWHIGEPPDPRAAAAARRRGYSVDGQRAAQIGRDDIRQATLVLALDSQNLRDLRRLAGDEDGHRVRLLGGFAGVGDVPDPYYGDGRDFAAALDIIEAACDGVVAHMAGA